jgi:hypothetical protein
MAPRRVRGPQLPGDCLGRLRMSTWQATDPGLLARRCRAADHLGHCGDPRSEQAASEPGHLSAAGHRTEQADHALAVPSGRGARLSRPSFGQRQPALSHRRCPGRRSGHAAGRRDAGPRPAVRVSVRRPAARFAHRNRALPGQFLGRAGVGRDRPGGPHPAGSGQRGRRHQRRQRRI